MADTPNNPVNPFKRIRLEHGLTHDAIAHRTGLTRLAVIRNEQGVFTDPNPTLLNYFSHRFNIPKHSLIDEYHNFQLLRRVLSFDHDVLSSVYLQQVLKINHPGIHVNPCVQWRNNSDPLPSKAKLSTAFCIHPATISKIELKPHTIIGDLPEQYLTALRQAGYYEEGLTLLNEKFKEYVKRLNEDLSKKTRTTT